MSSTHGGAGGSHSQLRKQGEWNFTQEAWANGSALNVSVLASTLSNSIMGARFGVCVCVEGGAVVLVVPRGDM